MSAFWSAWTTWASIRAPSLAASISTFFSSNLIRSCANAISATSLSLSRCSLCALSCSSACCICTTGSWACSCACCCAASVLCSWESCAPAWAINWERDTSMFSGSSAFGVGSGTPSFSSICRLYKNAVCSAMWDCNSPTIICPEGFCPIDWAIIGSSRKAVWVAIWASCSW